MWQLIEGHKERPCFFSGLIQYILEIPRIAPMSPGKKHILIDNMIDAAMRSTENPETLYSSHRYGTHVENITHESGARIESLEQTLIIGLASSAILRGDHMELKSLLDQRVSYDVES